MADVTSLVKASGTFTAHGIWYDSSDAYRKSSAMFASWTMVVVYESSSLPMSRVNFCFSDFQFTYPAGVYSSTVSCLTPPPQSMISATIVSFESDKYKGEKFWVNDHYFGDNLFKGGIGQGMDILTWDLSQMDLSLKKAITFKVESYLTPNSAGTSSSVEGLFMPIHLVRYTM
uniref:Uncharacterized protein n=1 Tax=Compsopogon caeruleus TaxID=31354 RepID=A0A7S1XCS1_9RHOD